MEWDLGVQGIGLLLLMSLAFGVGAQLIMWRIASHQLWIVATVVYFLTGLFTSEVLFGWATEEDLQPNIDGLSFDEVLLFGLLATLLVMLGAWRLGQRGHPGAPPSTPHASV